MFNELFIDWLIDYIYLKTNSVQSYVIDTQREKIWLQA